MLVLNNLFAITQMPNVMFFFEYELDVADFSKSFFVLKDV